MAIVEIWLGGYWFYPDRIERAGRHRFGVDRERRVIVDPDLCVNGSDGVVEPRYCQLGSRRRVEIVCTGRIVLDEGCSALVDYMGLVRED